MYLLSFVSEVGGCTCTCLYIYDTKLNGASINTSTSRSVTAGCTWLLSAELALACMRAYVTIRNYNIKRACMYIYVCVKHKNNHDIYDRDAYVKLI
jgi:hypothetical protein